jgi:hypothetical protein
MKTRLAVSISAFIIVVPLLVVFYSCSGSTDSTPPGGGETSWFPHANGSEWIYSVLGMEFYRYVLSGTYDHPVAGECQQLIKYMQAKGEEDWVIIDIDYMKYENDEVWIYPGPATDDYSYLLYEFPLEVDNTWDYDENTTATVISVTNITVPAGAFTVYEIYYDCTPDDITIWYSNQVGCYGVMNHGVYNIGGPITMELSSYNIPSR